MKQAGIPNAMTLPPSKHATSRTPALPGKAEGKRWPALAPATLLVLLLNGCAMFEGHDEKPFMYEPLAKLGSPVDTTGQPEQARSGSNAQQGNERSTAFYQTPKPPAAQRSSVGNPPPPPQPTTDDATIAVNLEGIALPQFAQAVFGTILKRNISIDPQVQSRTDLVSLKTGKPQTANQLYSAAQAVLRSYGVIVSEYPGLVRILPDKAETGYLPEIRRGRAQPDVPAGLRPVFYLAELEHTSAASLSATLRTLFPNRLTIQDDAQRNALLLNGQSDVIAAAMESIQLLDQPLLRGRTSVRISPTFWSADELAKRLVDLLTAEGYSAALNAGAQTPILVLPIAPVNAVIVFAGNEQVLNHTLRWAQELDQSPQGKSGGFINYPVRNTNAADLAKTLQEIVGGATTAAPVAGAAPAAPAVGKKIVVSAPTNSLIIQTTPTEYQQWYSLLQELDRPAKSALIMATVAEVRLTDNEQFGFQWMLDQFRLNGSLVNVGTVNSIGTAPNGTPRISFANLAGNPRALLTLLATTNKIRILSNPSIVARNGESATIQVGQEVPILTSQISNANTSGTTGTGILQTIQYRNTGVILRVRPVIHSTGKLDLEVAQEVSAAQINETGVNTTPIILTRKVDTKLTVSDGNTMLLGGLIQENKTSGNSGIPLLKDIPYVGAFFRTAASSLIEKTELVILLTPYIMEDDFEATAMTNAFRQQFAWAKALARPEALNAKKSESRQPAVSVEPSTGQQPEGPASQPVVAQPAAKPAAKPHVSQIYQLPAVAPLPSNAVINVAPTQQTNKNLAPPPDATTKNSADVGNSPQAQTPVPAIPAKPVSDERLRQELLQSIINAK